MSDEWYYASGGVQQGPITIEELKSRKAAGQIAADSLVWKEGMADWKPWNEIPELSAGGSTLLTAATSTSPAGTGGQVYAPPGSNPIAGTMGLAKPPSYLWQSIACTLLCCLPFGVVGIVFAAKVDSLASVGNIPAAVEASNKAKFWCWMSFGFGFAFLMLYVILGLAGGLAGV